ncbi:Mediator of RNA polymerase II transcription subunit 18 [Operophtera brumata]|uniref:Mediator of RNA polymerase II transcription subunit 18 n=1 Tax=Operophtera brumata TaxID=104452 RepID=A0A0L7KWZ7_OPEBR|nr:Mediator of RNA polymerase II transcription subunit 18 [Operophtera brumata]
MSAANAAPITATDSLSQALKANIIPNQEYLLQGSVLDSAVEVLLHRLRGLCDNVDAGPETFDDQEVCFSLRDPNQQPDLGDKSRPTVVRSSLDIACSGMLIEFLTELGCRIEFEYSVLAPQGQDAIAEDMRAFADQLRPLVQLDKIDYKRLGHMAVT